MYKGILLLKCDPRSHITSIIYSLFNELCQTLLWVLGMAHGSYLRNKHKNTSLQLKKTYTILIKKYLLSENQRDLTEKVAFEMSWEKGKISQLEASRRVQRHRRHMAMQLYHLISPISFEFLRARDSILLTVLAC